MIQALSKALVRISIKRKTCREERDIFSLRTQRPSMSSITGQHKILALGQLQTIVQIKILPLPFR
jgi:hypothetical protein